jgi:hypothetical protein
LGLDWFSTNSVALLAEQMDVCFISTACNHTFAFSSIEDNCIHKMYETGHEARYIHGIHAAEIDITFILFNSAA